MQEALIHHAERLRRLVVVVRVATHVVLVAVQAPVVAGASHRNRRADRAILVPAHVAVLILDDVALIHVVLGGMANQAVKPLLGDGGRRDHARRHHVLRCRMEASTDVTLAAALAPRYDLAAGVLRLRLDESGPSGP